MSHPSTGPGGARELVVFRPFDLASDTDTILAFARDLFAASFDDEGWFDRRFRSDGSDYLRWLHEVTKGDPTLACLAILRGKPVGMVVLGPEPDQPNTGHVYHIYLSETVRGLGLGKSLDEHALRQLAGHGFTLARLHVAPQNRRAIRFYERLGWTHAGHVPGKDVLAMTKPL